MDLLFDLAREGPERQFEASQAVDSKIFQAFAGASILIGLASVGGVRHSNLTAAFVALAVAAFLGVAYFAISALWSRQFRDEIDPRQLWRKYSSDSAYNIKHAFVADVADGFPVNEKHISDKHRALRRTLLLLLVEAAAIGAALVAAAV